MSSKSTYHTFCVKWVNQGLITGKTEAVKVEKSEPEKEEEHSDVEEEVSLEENEEKPESEIDSDEEIRRRFNMDDYDDSDEDDFSKQIANFQSSQLKRIPLCRHMTLNFFELFLSCWP